MPSPEIEPLLNLCYQLVKFRFGGHIFIVNNLDLACLLGNNSQEIEEIKKGLPVWIMLTSIEGYGILPEDKVASEEADFKALAAEYKLQPVNTIGGASAEKLSGLLGKMEGNDKLESLLGEVISNSEAAKSLADEMGVSEDEAGDDGSADS